MCSRKPGGLKISISTLILTPGVRGRSPLLAQDLVLILYCGGKEERISQKAKKDLFPGRREGTLYEGESAFISRKTKEGSWSLHILSRTLFGTKEGQTRRDG